MNSKKIWLVIALVFSVLFGLLGVAFIMIYVMEAIVWRIGDPNQSLLYWYLPILFIGITCLGLGWSLRACPHQGRKQSRSENDNDK